MSFENKIRASELKVGNIRFVAIDGHGGSGKSTLAEILAKKLRAEIIHIDDFAGLNNSDDWVASIEEKVFFPIQKGAACLNYPRTKSWESPMPEPVINQPVTETMILEGVSSNRKEFRKYISFSIFVDTPVDVCLKRGFERDKGQDGKSDEEIAQIWQGWLYEEKIYMERDRPKQRADAILDGTIPFDVQLSEQ